MANDDTQQVFANLLEGIVERSAAQRSTQQALTDVVRNLGSATTASVALPDLERDVGGGGIAGVGRPLSEQAESQNSGLLARQLAELTRAAVSQSDLMEANTQAILQNSAGGSSGRGSSTVATIGKTVLSVLGGGVGLVQLLGKLFGGGSSEQTQPTFERYTLPPPVNVQAALSHSPVPSISSLRYAADGTPRVLAAAPPAQQPTPVTIQVQAMDSRSFMDHSSEIAQAVREALLHSHSLNDVVMEL